MVDFCHILWRETTMKNIIKIVGSFVLAFVLILPLSIQAYAETTAQEAYNTSSHYMLERVPNPTYGDEWVIIALARGEANVPATYFDTYYQNLQQQIQEKQGNLHKYKYTEYARVILALSAIGKDATNVSGYNLVEKLQNFDQVVWQGMNGPIFALIALDSWGYEATVRDKYIQAIVESQLENGGFALSGDAADLDITAMAIQALAPYKEREHVALTIQRAQSFMKQQSKIGYNSSETVAQIVTALSSIGINSQNDKQIERLLDFYNEADGGFKHVHVETASNGMATEQASYALAAYHRFLNGQSSLYDMQDTRSSFRDTATSWAKDYIEQSYRLGLINGFEDGTFRPNNHLTRSQSAVILVRAMKFNSHQTAPYLDLGNMPLTMKNEIAAAYEAGIIKYNNGVFNPNDKVTRIQLALMLLRTYNQQQAPFSPEKYVFYKDTVNLGEEQQVALTFLAQHEIAQGSNGNFNPNQPTTRAEATKMLINFLKVME